MGRIVAATLAGTMFLAACAFSQVVSAAGEAAKTDATRKSEAKKTDDATKKTEAAVKPAAPADRVVVMYFHRTKRCPRCRAMGGYTEEAMKKGFAKDIEKGKVEFHFVNFEDEKNAGLTKGYKVQGPTLIVARVADNKTAEYMNLMEIWQKVGDKKAFIEYVQENVKDYQTKNRKTNQNKKQP
jgi:hypothetical protein